MRFESSRLTRSVTCTPAFFDSSEDQQPDSRSGVDRALPAKNADDKCSTSSTSTSSIGRNSDLSSERSMGNEDQGENEAQSAFNGTLDMMQSLEQVLPVRHLKVLRGQIQVLHEPGRCFFLTFRERPGKTRQRLQQEAQKHNGIQSCLEQESKLPFKKQQWRNLKETTIELESKLTGLGSGHEQL